MNYLNSAIDETERSSVLENAAGLWEIPEKCKCGFPLHLRSGGTIAFCPRCHDKAEWAAKGRDLLAMAKRRWAEKIDKAHHPLVQTYEELIDERDANREPFRVGLPL